MSATAQSQMACEILAYLARNPDAQDTMEGIAEWWLLAQQVERQIAKVKEALAELVDRGLIVERKGNDSRIYYRLNKRRTGEISKLLEHRNAELSNP